MEVKGTAVKSIIEFVARNHKEKYQDWYGKLPSNSQKQLSGVVTSGWYDVESTIIEPTKAIAAMFYNSDANKAAWESGRHSAEAALNGIYKLYVRATSPAHIISRGGRIMSAYYRPAKLEVTSKRSTSIVVEVTEFNKPHAIIENRIGGWIERALEISGCKNLTVKTVKSFSNGDLRTIYDCRWS